MGHRAFISYIKIMLSKRNCVFCLNWLNFMFTSYSLIAVRQNKKN